MHRHRPVWGAALLVLGLAGCQAQASRPQPAPASTAAPSVTTGSASDKSYDRAAQQDASAHLQTDPAAGSQAGVIQPDQSDGQALAPGAEQPQPRHP